MRNAPPQPAFLSNRVPRSIILVTGGLAIFYTFLLAFWFPVSNAWLFGLLIFTQCFFLWQGLTFQFTVWNMGHMPKGDPRFAEPVDVFITVAGEPAEVVEETLLAALAMDYPDFSVHILNDGYVAKKDNWKEIEDLAAACGANCITRRVPGGAKAGNINNGMRETSSPFVVVFDTDHVPHPDFLRKTMPYFADPRMGFVQSPQYYKNCDESYLTGAAWEQQEIFFGAICKGKNRMNSVTMCGTNMAIRRTAILEAGGMCATNIAEDFVTGLFIHQRGWKSAYVPEVLAEGLAPEDFLSYYKQQLRWARGSLEVVFRFNPFFKRGLSAAQKVQYMSSASYFLSGVVVLIDIALPLVFFYTGQVPFVVSTMALAIAFLPYIFMALYTVQLATNFTYTFRALAFSISSWPIHLRAMWGAVTGAKARFDITSKRALSGKFTRLAAPHILYCVLSAGGVLYALYHYGLTASVATNTAWAFLNCAVFWPFIKAARGSAKKT